MSGVVLLLFMLVAGLLLGGMSGQTGGKNYVAQRVCAEAGHQHGEWRDKRVRCWSEVEYTRERSHD